MRTQTFYQLDVDSLLMIFHYLGPQNLSVWFSLAVTDKLFLDLAYSIVAMEMKERYNPIFYRVVNACNREMRKVDLVRDEKLQLSTAKYFLYFGLEQDTIIHLASEQGHVTTLNMLRQRCPHFRERGHEVALMAARNNKGNVIEFLDDHNISFRRSATDDTVVNIAITHLSHSVIQALGYAGFNFAAINPKTSISYMQQVMKFELDESEATLNKRFRVLFAMLESGSFPKLGAKGFLSWMDEHLESVKPHLYDVFTVASIVPNIEEHVQYGNEQIENEKILVAAYNTSLRPKVQAALIKFEYEYRRLSSGIQKTRAAKAGRSPSDEKSLELAPIRNRRP